MGTSQVQIYTGLMVLMEKGLENGKERKGCKFEPSCRPPSGTAPAPLAGGGGTGGWAAPACFLPSVLGPRSRALAKTEKRREERLGKRGKWGCWAEAAASAPPALTLPAAALLLLEAGGGGGGASEPAQLARSWRPREKGFRV